MFKTRYEILDKQKVLTSWIPQKRKEKKKRNTPDVNIYSCITDTTAWTYALPVSISLLINEDEAVYLPFIVSAIHWGILSSLALLSSLDVSSLFQSPDWSSGSKVTLGSSPWNCSSNDTSLSTLTIEISASEVAGVLSDLQWNHHSPLYKYIFL